MGNAIKRQFRIFRSLYTNRTFIIIFLIIILNAFFFQEVRVNSGIWIIFLFVSMQWKHYLGLKYISKERFFWDMVGVSFMTLLMNTCIVAVFLFGLRMIFGPEVFIDSAMAEATISYGLNSIEVGNKLFWAGFSKELMLISGVMVIQLYILSRPYRIHLNRPSEMMHSVLRLVSLIAMVVLLQMIPVSFRGRFIIGLIGTGIGIYINYHVSFDRYDRI